MEGLRAIWRQGLTGFQLKIIALITMVIDHVGAVFFPEFDFLRAIGRTAFLLYAFLTAEGCRRTGDRKRYLLRLGLFALISEVPFDLAFGYVLVGDRLPSVDLLSHTSVFFTLFFAVTCVRIYDTLLHQPRRIRLLGGGAGCLGVLLGILLIRVVHGARLPVLLFLYGYTLCALAVCARLPAPGDGAPEARRLSKIPAAVPLLLVVFLAEVSHCDYGAFGVLLILLLYIARTPERAAAFLAAAGLFYYGAVHSLRYGLHPWYLVFSLAAAMLAFFYNGQRGRNIKWAFYWAYPAHIAVIAALRAVFLLPV